jgi:hypothetical protein
MAKRTKAGKAPAPVRALELTARVVSKGSKGKGFDKNEPCCDRHGWEFIHAVMFDTTGKVAEQYKLMLDAIARNDLRASVIDAFALGVEWHKSLIAHAEKHVVHAQDRDARFQAARRAVWGDPKDNEQRFVKAYNTSTFSKIDQKVRDAASTAGISIRSGYSFKRKNRLQ